MKSFEYGDEKLRKLELGLVTSSTNIDIGALSMSRDITMKVLFSDCGIILILGALILALLR